MTLLGLCAVMSKVSFSLEHIAGRDSPSVFLFSLQNPGHGSAAKSCSFKGFKFGSHHPNQATLLCFTRPRTPFCLSCSPPSFSKCLVFFWPHRAASLLSCSSSASSQEPFEVHCACSVKTFVLVKTCVWEPRRSLYGGKL